MRAADAAHAALDAAALAVAVVVLARSPPSSGAAPRRQGLREVAVDDGQRRAAAAARRADGWDPAASAAVAERRAAVASLSIDDCGDGSYAIRFTIRRRRVRAPRPRLPPRLGRAARPRRPRPAARRPHGSARPPAAAGEAVPVELIAHDALGNRCDGGGAGFELQLWHAAGDAAPALGGQPSYVSCTLEDNNDGSYSGTYASARVGAYLLSALLDGVPVAPPASVAVLPGRTSAAASALAPAAPSVVVGTPAAAHHPRPRRARQRSADGRRSVGGEVRPRRRRGGGAASARWRRCATTGARRQRCAIGVTARTQSRCTPRRWTVRAERSLLHSAPRGPQPLDPYESDLGGGSGHRERHEAARPLPQPPLLFDATAAPLSELCSVEWLLPPHPFVAGELRALIRAADGHGNGVTTLPPGASAFFERLRDDDESAPPLRVTARLVGVGEPPPLGAPSVQRLHHRHADPPPTPLSGRRCSRAVFQRRRRRHRRRHATANARRWRRRPGCACWRKRWRGDTCRWWCSGSDAARPTASRRRWCRRARPFRTRTVRASPAGWRARQSFHVALRDVYSNPIDGRHASIERALAVRVTREGAPGEAPVPVDVTEVERGVVQIDWCAPRAGSYAVRSRRAAELCRLPAPAPSAPRPFAAACVASGAGCAARPGGGADVEVQLADAHGNELCVGGGGSLDAALTAADGTLPCKCASRDWDDGSHRLTYVPTAAGPALLHVCWRDGGGGGSGGRGAPIGGRPSRSRWWRARRARRGARRGARQVYARPGRVSYLTVVARDRHGNECRRGGERLTVQCCGPTHPIISSADRGDGTYRVGVRYGLSGEYELSVRVGKATIGGSPFKVHVGLRSMEAAVATWRQRFARREAAVVAKVFDAWRQFVGHRAVSRRSSGGRASWGSRAPTGSSARRSRAASRSRR